MQISDITRGKKKPISEVNWGAIGGALTGIANQAITGKTPQATPGQEQTVAKQILQPLQNQQIDAVVRGWNNMVAAKMAQQGFTDPNQLGVYMLNQMLTSYIENRLFAGRQQIARLSPKYKTAITQDMRGIILASKTNNTEDLREMLGNLVKNVQAATMAQTYSSAGTQATGQLTPAAQIMMQRMSPQIAQLQKSWPPGQNQQVLPTTNQAVNALLAGLGLLRTSNAPVVPGAPQQTPPPGNTP